MMRSSVSRLLACTVAAACGPVDQTIGASVGLGQTSTGTSTGTTAPPLTDPTSTAATSSTTAPPPGCVVDEDCEWYELCESGVCEYNVCSLSTGHCPDCLNDADCEPGERCDGIDCVPIPCFPEECVGHLDCAPGHSCFDTCCSTVDSLPACVPYIFDAASAPLGSPATALALADLDGDADLDLLAAEPAAGALELALNNGDATFAPGVLVDLGGPSVALTFSLGDLDGDADPDVIVARAAPDELRVFLNDGGLLDQTAVVPLAFGAHAVAVARVDDDAFPDFVAVDLAQQFPVVWRGDGMGSLLTTNPVDFFATGPGLVVTDLDQDGRADLVNQPLPGADTIELALADGMGLYHPETSLPGPGVTRVLVGDLDVSGETDLVATYEVGRTGGVHLWYRAAAPQDWSLADPIVTPALLGGVLVDLDDDFNLELVAATGGSFLAILQGTTDRFTCRQHLPLTDAATTPELLAVGDLDGDARPDIVAGTPTGVVILRQL